MISHTVDPPDMSQASTRVPSWGPSRVPSWGPSQVPSGAAQMFQWTPEASDERTGLLARCCACFCSFLTQKLFMKRKLKQRLCRLTGISYSLFPLIEQSFVIPDWLSVTALITVYIQAPR